MEKNPSIITIISLKAYQTLIYNVASGLHTQKQTRLRDFFVLQRLEMKHNSSEIITQHRPVSFMSEPAAEGSSEH